MGPPFGNGGIPISARGRPIMSGFWQRLTGTARRPSGAPRARLRCDAMEDRSVPSAGALDPTFGTGGQVILFNNGAAFSGGMTDRAATTLADGSTIVVGTVRTANFGLQIGVERYTSAG